MLCAYVSIIKTEFLHLPHFAFLLLLLYYKFETLLCGQKNLYFLNTLLIISLLLCFEHGYSGADLQTPEGKIFIQIKAFKFFIWPPHIQTSQRHFHQSKIYSIGVLALTNIRTVRKHFSKNILNIKKRKELGAQYL